MPALCLPMSANARPRTALTWAVCLSAVLQTAEDGALDNATTLEVPMLPDGSAAEKAPKGVLGHTQPPSAGTADTAEPQAQPLAHATESGARWSSTSGSKGCPPVAS